MTLSDMAPAIGGLVAIVLSYGYALHIHKGLSRSRRRRRIPAE